MGSPMPAGEYQDRSSLPRHRADYLLQRGEWRVTCRVCGWQATGLLRRQLATLFRFHLRMSPVEPAAPTDDD